MMIRPNTPQNNQYLLKESSTFISYFGHTGSYHANNEFSVLHVKSGWGTCARYPHCIIQLFQNSTH